MSISDRMSNTGTLYDDTLSIMKHADIWLEPTVAGRAPSAAFTYQLDQNPEILEIPYLYPLKGTGYLEEMLFNFKPIHIPDLDKDIPFRDELEEKFFHRYRSSLLLPMQYDGNYIGFLGFFTRTRTRLYNLADLDILQRFADMCTAAIIAHFYKEHGDVDLDDIKRKMKKETLGDTMNNL